IPKRVPDAVDIALHGDRRRLDVGCFNGERFAVMAGAGFDALMIDDADGAAKQRFGRWAYLWTGAKHLREPRVLAKVRVDGDGWLEVGVVTATGVVQWARAFARTAFGHASRSPLVSTTKARSIKVKLGRAMRYELDGGARGIAKRLRIEVEPRAVTICVPPAP